MGGESFDDLLRALQSSLAAAQDSLEKRRAELDRAICGVDETGAPRSPLLSFALPKSGAHEDEYETVTLPLSGFHDRRRPRLTTLSLEFECELTEKRLSFFFGERRMVMRIRKSSEAHDRKRRNVRMVFHGAERPFGEVRINGELLMVIPPMEGSAGRRIAVAAKWSFFRALADLWRKLRRPTEFALTKEQAGRIRDIAEQSEHGDVNRGKQETAGQTIS